MRDDADQGALERTDVLGDPAGDQLEHGGVGDRDLVQRGALAQDRDPGGEVRCGDVGHQSGLEPLAQTRLDPDQRPREPVTGDHELAAVLVERVEGVEELLLGPGLAGQELDVVDQQHVGVAVGALERLEPARRARA